jgi:hypothetical protein
VQVGIGGTSGMVTDDSETFRLDNLESEVVGGACGAPNRLFRTQQRIIKGKSQTVGELRTSGSCH